VKAHTVSTGRGTQLRPRIENFLRAMCNGMCNKFIRRIWKKLMSPCYVAPRISNQGPLFKLVQDVQISHLP